MLERSTFAAIAMAAAVACGTATAQQGALDSDPYFTDLPADPYTAPPRATDSATQGTASPQQPRALPRPRSGQTLAYAAPTAAAPAASSPSAAASAQTARRPAPQRPALRPLSAYIEARSGWDAIRGSRRDDGILLGATAGFDRAFARFAGGQVYGGVLASIDFSSARRANADVLRDETGALPVLTLTERRVEEMRDIEVGARLGWRNTRFGLYLMAAIANTKRETETRTTTFTERPDPDDATGVAFTEDSVQTTGAGGVYADGLRLGAGAEVRVIGPAYVHLGYRFTDDDGGAERHQVLTGIGARF